MTLTTARPKANVGNKWSHGDLLRLSHPLPNTPEHDALFSWIVGKREVKRDALPALVTAFEQVQDATPLQAVELIAAHGLSWEMLPDRLMNEPLVWEAMLDKGVPQTALLRQLPRLTRIGLTTGRMGALIAKQLVDLDQLKRGRVHPISVLIAQRTYAAGRSERGDGVWSPTPAIIDALHDAFYAAYGAVEPAGKRTLIASDVSGSMTWNAIGGFPLRALEVCGVMALVIANTEPEVTQVGFTTSAWPLTISKRQRIDDVMKYMQNQPNGGTDCSAPILWALQNKIEVDSIVLMTDEQSWAGRIHPFQALRQYREQINPNARLVSVAMTPTGGSIADPDDASCMSVAGMDTSVPQVITEFSAGRL